MAFSFITKKLTICLESLRWLVSCPYTAWIPYLVHTSPRTQTKIFRKLWWMYNSFLFAFVSFSFVGSTKTTTKHFQALYIQLCRWLGLQNASIQDTAKEIHPNSGHKILRTNVVHYFFHLTAMLRLEVDDIWFSSLSFALLWSGCFIDFGPTSNYFRLVQM